MSSTATLVLVVVAVGTVAALTLTVLVLVTRIRTMTAKLTDMQTGLRPQLDALQAEALIAQSELERLQRATDGLKAHRR